MTVDQAKDLISHARAAGVLALEYDGLKIELSAEFRPVAAVARRKPPVERGPVAPENAIDLAMRYKANPPGDE